MRPSERLKYTRRLYELSQETVGKYLGVTRNYINQLENDKLVMSQEKFMKILNAIYYLGEEKKHGRLQAVMEDIKVTVEETKPKAKAKPKAKKKTNKK